MKKLLLIVSLFFTVNLYGQFYYKPIADSFISKWLGKPYRYGGETKKGIDCSAFTREFYRIVLGFDIPRTAYYQELFLRKVKREDLRPGDIIFFNSKVSPSKRHCGVYIGSGQFIHAANYREGVKISCIDDEPYNRIYRGAGRL